jgi:hypothetical protein
MALFGRMATALAGRAVARTVGGAGAGPAGMVIGAALPMVARRLGPLGMIGFAVGAWAVGKVVSERAAAKHATDVHLPLPDLVEAPDPNPRLSKDLSVAKFGM